MADFPVTANGTTWNASDFEGSKYARNLFNFLDGVIVEATASLNSYVTSSMTIGDSDVTMTLPSKKDYVIGQRLRMVPAVDENTSDFLSGYMEGYVVSYDTGTGVLVLHPLMRQGAGTYSMWHISPGGEPVPVFPAISASQGGQSSIQGYAPITVSSEFFEDFTGTVSANLRRGSQGRGIVVDTTGTARAYFEGNAKAAESLNYANQALNGDHPGIAVLEVATEGNTAEINLGSCSANLNNGGMYRVMFLLDYENSPSNASYMQIGLRTYTGTEFDPGAMLEYPRANGTNAVCSVFDNATHQASLPLESGVWYEIRIYCLTGAFGPDEIEAQLYRVNQYSVDLVYTFPHYPWFLPGAAKAVMPFIRLKKLYGRRASRLWVDYLHFNPNISR